MSSNSEDNNTAEQEAVLQEPENSPMESEIKDDKSEKVENDKKDSEKEGNSKEGDKKKENKKNNKEPESDDSENEESDDEKEMGLLDRPVEVTGCRARKQVERLEVSFALPNKDMQIPEGSGKKLGDCPRIEFQISKHSVADLKPLHRVLFNRQGTANDTKKNIRKFSGFPFQKNSVEFDQKKSKTEKFSIPILKGMCEVLDIERGGTKEDIITRLLEFLVSPSDSGKALPKKKSSGRDKKTAGKKKSKNDKKKSKAKVSEEEVPSSADEDSDASAIEKDEESDEETTKKSKAKKKKAPVKVKTAKKEKPKKEAKGSKRKKDIVSDDSSDDSEPIAKKSKLPDDDDIKQLVKTILDKADLHEITMKKVIKQVYDTYPECDLTDKKPFIKMTIKSVLQLNEKGENDR